MKKILVTGGSGFIGSALVAELVKNETFSVTVMGRNSFADGYNFLKADIRDPRLDISDFDIIYHLAAISSPSKAMKNEKMTWDINVNGTKNILEKMRNGQKIIFTSSAAVYGKNWLRARKESDELYPENLYALTKIIGENIVKYYSWKTDFNYVILRPFNVYGENQESGYLVSDIISKYSNNRKIVDVISPDSVVDMIYINDLVNVLLQSIINKGTFNVCTGKPIKISEVYFKIKSMMGVTNKKERIRHEKKYYLVGDVQKMRKNFDIKMRIFESGLKKIFNQ